MQQAILRNKAQLKAMAGLQAKKKREFDEKQERKNQMRRLAVEEDRRRERNKKTYKDLQGKQISIDEAQKEKLNTNVVNSRESACKKKVV